MTSKKINLAELICQAIAITLLFIPGMFNWEHWEEIEWGISQLALRMPITFFHAAGNTNEVLGYLIATIMFANVAILILYIFKDVPQKYEKIYLILPCASVGLMVLFAVLAGIRDDYGYCAPTNWLFYVDMLFLSATTVLAFMKLSKKVNREDSVKAVIAPTDSVEELAKHK